MITSMDDAERALVAKELGLIRWWRDACGDYWFEPQWWQFLGMAAATSAMSRQQLEQLQVQPVVMSASTASLVQWRHNSGHLVQSLWLAVNADYGWLRLETLPTRLVQLQLAALVRMVGEDAVSDVLRDFATSLTKLQQQLADAVQARDHQQLERCSHKLKSSCRLVGATDTALQLEQLELACRQGSVDDLAERWAELQPRLQALAGEVEQKLAD